MKTYEEITNEVMGEIGSMEPNDMVEGLAKHLDARALQDLEHTLAAKFGLDFGHLFDAFGPNPPRGMLSSSNFSSSSQALRPTQPPSTSSTQPWSSVHVSAPASN